MAPSDASSVWSHAALALKARSGYRAVRRAQQAVPAWARGASRAGVPGTVTQPRKGSSSRGKRREIVVFVLDRHKKPLMPCSPKRARLLLAHKRAVVHRLSPFVIRLKDRRVEESTLQPVALKVDPDSRTSGMALVREEATAQGPLHHALHLCEVRHRGTAVHQAMLERANHRRRRRSANLRYREPRFDHRTCAQGWLPPSLASRVGNVLAWARRYGRWEPLRHIEVERVKFDLQLLQNPEVSSLEYQRGERAGWETRAY
jgi:hypothetical protein